MKIILDQTGEKTPKKRLLCHIAQKIKFFIKDFSSKCDQIRRKSADSVTFTEELLNEIFDFLCSVTLQNLKMFYETLRKG